MSLTGSENCREIVVNDIGNLTANDLGNYFYRFGYISYKDVRLKSSHKVTDDGRPFKFAFIRFQDASGCSAALASSVHVINGQSCNVGLCNNEKLRRNYDGIAAGTEAEFKLFGNFMDFQGFRYLLNNSSFGSVGDYAVSLYMQQNEDVPSSIGNDTNVIDCLVAMEGEEAAIARHEAIGDLASSQLHRAVHVNLLAALDEYSRRIDTTQPPANERIMWVAHAPASTTYRHIREKFHGEVHDVIFQRRGPPDFSCCSGYYVIFSSASDAAMGFHNDGYPAVAVSDDNWWHRTFWLFFIRRTLAVSAVLNNAGLSSHSWRHSKYSGDRQYAIARAFEALQSDNFDDSTEQEASNGECTPAIDTQPPATREEHKEARSASPIAAQNLSWNEQAEKFDMDAYFECQRDYEDWREYVRRKEGKRRPRKKNKANVGNDVDTSKAALRRDLAYTLYQVYGDTRFFKRVGYPRRMQFPTLKECDRVTPGYFIEKCSKWLSRNATFRNEIVKFLRAADEIYADQKHHMLSKWSADEGNHSVFDDGTLFGIPDEVLSPPPDFRITLVEDEGGLQQIVDHLRCLTKWDAVSLDTEGHGDPYVGPRVDVIQFATSRKECFLLDVQKSYGSSLMGLIGAALAEAPALRFGQNFGNADSENFWADLDFHGNAPVHEISRMVLKIMGMDETTARKPSLENVTKFVLNKDLPKDARLSLWDGRVQGHLTARQQRYAAMDVIVIILILDECRRLFPNRFKRYWDNFSLLKYVPRFEYQNWNEEAHNKRALPEPLHDDDPPYHSRI